eukprot:3251059-Rhodomonas_salina.1
MRPVLSSDSHWSSDASKRSVTPLTCFLLLSARPAAGASKDASWAAVFEDLAPFLEAVPLSTAAERSCFTAASARAQPTAPSSSTLPSSPPSAAHPESHLTRLHPTINNNDNCHQFRSRTEHRCHPACC